MAHPSLIRQQQAKEANPPTSSTFCYIPTLSELDDTHREEENLLIQSTNSNILTDVPQNQVYREHPMTH